MRAIPEARGNKMNPDVELILKSDERYGMFITKSMQFDAAKDSGREKDSFAAEHQINLLSLENATLAWFATHERISLNLVLISRTKGHSPFGLYDCQEMDFVGGSADSPDVFGELKTSVSPASAMKTARKQLRKRMTIGSQRWPHVAGLVVCFAMNWGMQKSWHGSTYSLESVGSILGANHLPNEITSFVFDGSELLNRLVCDGYLAPSFPDQIANSFRLLNDPTSCLIAQTNDFTLGNAFDQISGFSEDLR